MSKFAFWKSARPFPLQRLAIPAAILAGALCTSPATAVDLAENLQLHGFASQAFVWTSDNKFFGNSDKGSFDFRELGANLSWQPQPYLQFAAQVGSRRAGGTEINANPRFDYAFVDVAPLSGDRGRAGFRAGRYRIPLGLYNLTRDVANTRPSIFLPESVYNDPSRQLVLAIDGAEGYGEARTSIGDFFLNYGEGKFILDDIQKQSSKATNSSVWRVLYDDGTGSVRLAVSRVDANLDAILPPFAHPKVNLALYLYSAQYNAEKWSLTGEYVPDAVGTVSGLVIPGIPGLLPDLAFPDVVQKGEAYYVQGTYQIATDWEALLRYDVAYSDKTDKSGVRNSAASMLTATPAPPYRYFAKDLTLGIGWSVRPDTKIRAEWHHVNGTSWLSARENPNLMDTKQYWDMFALQVSYNF